MEKLNLFFMFAIIMFVISLMFYICFVQIGIPHEMVMLNVVTILSTFLMQLPTAFLHMSPFA